MKLIQNYHFYIDDIANNLKEAAKIVLEGAVKAGNITSSQYDDIQHELTSMLDTQYHKNLTGENFLIQNMY